MFVRRQFGRLWLIQNMRINGAHRQIHYGIADDKTVQKILAAKRSQETKKRLAAEMLERVDELDDLLAEEWRDIWRELNRALNERGYRYERATWRQRRAIKKQTSQV
jgi:hypothetical protein